MSSKRGKRSKRVSVLAPRTTVTVTTGTRVTESSGKVTKTTSGSAGPNFRQRMINNGIYPKGYEYPDGRVPPKPDNWDEIRKKVLATRQSSLSPSAFTEENFEEFTRADDRALSEDDVRERVISLIQGASRDSTSIGRNTLFNNLASIFLCEAQLAEEEEEEEEEEAKEVQRGPVSGRNLKPDYYYGAHPEQLPLKIRTELDDKILPSTDNSRPMLPNFFIEAKGPSGSNLVCVNQACIDGALGARAMYSLQMHGQQIPTYDNKAYTLSATYQSGQLKIYTHHLAQPNGPETDPEYYMHQLRAFAMTDDREALLQAMTAFRNAEDWTRAQRNAAIERANAIANGVITNDRGDDIDEEEDEVATAVVDPILSSFTSQSPFSTGQTTSRRSRMALTSGNDL